MKSWGSAKEKNKNKPEGTLEQSQQKLLSSLSCCPFLNLARSADLHECDVFMALGIIGSDSSMTEGDSTLYENRLKGVSYKILNLISSEWGFLLIRIFSGNLGNCSL